MTMRNFLFFKIKFILIIVETSFSKIDETAFYKNQINDFYFIKIIKIDSIFKKNSQCAANLYYIFQSQLLILVQICVEKIISLRFTHEKM